MPTAMAQTMAETNRTIDGALWFRQRWVNVLPMSPIIPVKTPTAMNHWGNICIILPLSAGAPRAALIIANVTVPIKEAAVASVHSTQTTVADSAARVSCPGSNSSGASSLLATVRVRIVVCERADRDLFSEAARFLFRFFLLIIGLLLILECSTKRELSWPETQQYYRKTAGTDSDCRVAPQMILGDIARQTLGIPCVVFPQLYCHSNYDV